MNTLLGSHDYRPPRHDYSPKVVQTVVLGVMGIVLDSHDYSPSSNKHKIWRLEKDNDKEVKDKIRR